MNISQTRSRKQNLAKHNLAYHNLAIIIINYCDGFEGFEEVQRIYTVLTFEGLFTVYTLRVYLV